MKSAVELAMERLEKQAPSARLTEEKKRELAEIDNTFKARIAEREVFLRDQIAKEATAGKLEDVAQLERQLSSEIRRLQEDCESKKEQARAAG